MRVTGGVKTMEKGVKASMGNGSNLASWHPDWPFVGVSVPRAHDWGDSSGPPGSQTSVSAEMNFIV